MKKKLFDCTIKEFKNFCDKRFENSDHPCDDCPCLVYDTAKRGSVLILCAMEDIRQYPDQTDKIEIEV